MNSELEETARERHNARVKYLILRRAALKVMVQKEIDRAMLFQLEPRVLAHVMPELMWIDYILDAENEVL